MLLIGFAILLRPLTLTLIQDEPQTNVEVKEDVPAAGTNIHSNKTKFKTQGNGLKSR